MKFYDFVIVSEGCSGLSLAKELARANGNQFKLLIDSNIHVFQDKTLRCWDTLINKIFPIKLATWKNMSFHTNEYEKKEEFKPLKYFGIKSADFYPYSFEVLQKSENIEILENHFAIKSIPNRFALIYQPKKNVSKPYSPIYQSIR